jgi:saccharopine dehydrogenase-like NADP-dependent oxidoreductase
MRLDVTHHATVVGLMRGRDAVISAVPYTFNLGLAKRRWRRG